jgi:hypothetical protein
MKLLTHIKFYLLLFGVVIIYVNSLRREHIDQLETIDLHEGNEILDVEINLNKDKNITVHLSNKTFYDENSVIINKKFCDFKKMKQKFKNKFLNESQTEKMNYSQNLNHTNLYFTNSSSNNLSSIDSEPIFNSNSSRIHLTGPEHKSNNSISSDDLLSIIADQTENIKNEICSSCLEINTSLNILIDEIKLIKKTLHNLALEKPSIIDVYTKILNSINNLNLIKADLFKLNEILDTLQKANCNNFMENSKKYTLVVNSSNKLLEKIQDSLKSFNININLVVLN